MLILNIYDLLRPCIFVAPSATQKEDTKGQVKKGLQQFMQPLLKINFPVYFFEVNKSVISAADNGLS